MSYLTFPNGYALLIGVGADLPITVKDAAALHDILVNPSHAAYPDNQVKLLTETEAKRTEILSALDVLIEQVNGNPNATAIVYFSGHGIEVKMADKPAEYFLVSYGYVPGQWADTAISGPEFTAKIEAINASKLVVFLDCCYAGGIPTYKGQGDTMVKSVPLPPELLTILDKGNGRVIVASSLADEKSYTGAPYSVFTTCLIEALMGKAAVKQDGFARILDVLIYLLDQVPQRASGPQHPLVNRIHDLHHNFPLCYYAGGSKDVPGEGPGSAPTPPTLPRKPTPMQRRRLEERRDILLNERAIRIERIRRQRKAWTIEMNPGYRFQFEVQIQEDEKALLPLDNELDDIEERLR